MYDYLPSFLWSACNGRFDDGVVVVQSFVDHLQWLMANCVTEYCCRLQPMFSNWVMEEAG